MFATKYKTVNTRAYVHYPDGTYLEIFKHGGNRYSIIFREFGEHQFSNQELINLVDNGPMANWDTDVCSNLGGKVIEDEEHCDNTLRLSVSVIPTKGYVNVSSR